MQTLPLRGWNFLCTPGPTNIPERIQRAMHRPAIDFSSPEFVAFATSLREDIKPIFQTESEVFIYAANGHGAWEAALVNTLSPGDQVLVPETGMFSLAWMAMARSLGIEVEYMKSDWRHGVQAELIAERLSRDPEHRIKAVMMVHTDTATGITSHPLAVRQALDVKHHPALLMVDVVASLVTIDFPMDRWGVDVAVGAGQKGLMLPPGLSFTATSPKALAVSERATLPRNYWDWRRRLGSEHYLWFCGTPPEHLLFGLREAIDMITEETLPGVFARHHRLANAVRAAIEVWSQAGAIEFNAIQSEERADSITAILTPAHDAEVLRAFCREKFNVSLGGGFGKLHGHCFRIGHMGYVNEPMILGTLASIETALSLCRIPHQSGGISAAMESLARAWAA